MTLDDALQLIYIVDADRAADGDRVDACLGAGVSAVWLRSPASTGAELYRLARDLRVRCDAHGAALLVGDRADVALAAEANGVQIGFRSPPARRVRAIFPGWMGVSCHTEAELASAARAGADFAVLSPVFGVPDKGSPLGTTVFGQLVAGCDLPVIGLGGIDETNVEDVRAQGSAGVAVIRALSTAEDPANATRRLRGA